MKGRPGGIFTLKTVLLYLSMRLLKNLSTPVVGGRNFQGSTSQEPLLRPCSLAPSFYPIFLIPQNSVSNGECKIVLDIDELNCAGRLEVATNVPLTKTDNGTMGSGTVDTFSLLSTLGQPLNSILHNLEITELKDP